MRARPFKVMSRSALLAIVGVAGILSIIASGGGGGGGGGSSTTTPATTPRYAFVANRTEGSVSSYVTDATTGRLKWIGKVVAGAGPLSVTLHPSGKYAYVANSNTTSVSQYSIGSNGSLTAMSPATAPAGTNPTSVAVDPTGKYAYAANFGVGVNAVSAYSVDTSGKLTQIICGGSASCSGSNFTAGTRPYFVAVDPSGKYVYAANYGDNTVTPFSINSDGSLTIVDCDSVTLGVQACPTGASPTSIVIDPSGKFAYVANSTSTTVSAYTINTTTGALTQINCGGGAGCSGADFLAGAGPDSVAVDPSGKYVYTANSGAASVSAYTINATTGALTQINCGGGAGCSGADFLAGTTPYSVTVDPSGKYVYVANINSDSVSQYTIGATGSLTALSPAPGRAGPAAITVLRGTAAVQAVPKYVYVTNSGTDNTVSQYTIAANGSLAAMLSPTVSTGTGPKSVAVDPSGAYAYVTNSGSSNVSQYTVGTDGVLTANLAGATVGAGTTPSSVAVDPAGRYAYVANAGSGNVSQYTIGSNGTLSGGTTITAGTSPSSVAVDPSGRYAYVANSGSGSVTPYSIGSSGGLTAIDCDSIQIGVQTCPAGTNPVSVAVDPSGRYVYVTNSDIASGNKVSQYSIGANGALTPMTPATVVAQTQPVFVTVDPTGRFAYVANYSDVTISQFTIGATGGLTTPSSTATPASAPTGIAVDPSGRFAYVANDALIGSVSQYTIGSTGSLTALGTANAGSNPSSVTTTGTWQ